MATAQNTAEYQDDALDFALELAENGYECSFGKEGEPVNAWEPALEYAETGTANVFPMEWKADFSAEVRADDRLFFVGNTVNVTDCTHMVEPNGDPMKIIETKEFKPDGQTVIFYEIQTR